MPVIGKVISTLASSPLIQRVVFPALANWASNWLSRQASTLEQKAALRQAKAATTAEEFREASRRLSDSTRG